jgi:hypothetical protein|tara:strand:+ start:62 stop:220 length:159 start_codon:yes stop_codon:yes gene_type:complete
MGFREDLIRKLLALISVLSKGQITKGETVKVLKKFTDELYYSKELEEVQSGS